MKIYLKHPKTGLIVSSEGEVYIPYCRRHPGHWTTGIPYSNNYLGIKFKGKHYLVHRLIAETFILNPENKPEVDHINRNRGDNRIENLRWVTSSENKRNTAQSDRVSSDGRTHQWEDLKRSRREWGRLWYAKNAEKRRAYKREWRRRRKENGLATH